MAGGEVRMEISEVLPLTEVQRARGPASTRTQRGRAHPQQDRPHGVERRCELVRRRDDAPFAKVGAVESKGQIEGGCVTLTADAFDRVANGGGYVGIDLEAPGLEPLPPVPEVEELEH